MSKPFLDRNVLIAEITSFTRQYNTFFRQQESRMSDFYEMSVYNEIVRYYERKRYTVLPQNLKAGNFLYRTSQSGLEANFSKFLCVKTSNVTDANVYIPVEIHHNLRIESAVHSSLYYNADISVCRAGAVEEIKPNRCRISVIPNNDIISFFEVKNLNPFPEVLFNFNGMLLEFAPLFAYGQVSSTEFNPGQPTSQKHLCPGLFFSGALNENTRLIADTLKRRYGHNIICGLAKNKGKVLGLRGLMEYAPI